VLRRVTYDATSRHLAAYLTSVAAAPLRASGVTSLAQVTLRNP